MTGLTMPAAAPRMLDSELERDLRASVRDMLADRCPPARVLARCEADQPYDEELWRTVSTAMGLTGLAVAEEYGGAGASLSEVAVVVEELGRVVAPVPYLSSAGVAATALAACGATDLLADLAGGRVVVLAVPFGTAPDAVLRGPEVSDDVLAGPVHGVADGLCAEVLLVPTATGLYAVDAGAPGVARTPVLSLDLTRRLADVDFDGAAGRLLAGGSAAAEAVRAALTAGAALLAAEQAGVAQWCLDTTVAYTRTRHQFGRPVGSFQAVKHRLADLWVAVTQARAVARYAVACAAAGDPDLPVAAALAQAHCGPVAVRAAEECVQLHGGIGFTWEHPAHLYLKRAKADAIGFGTADRHRSALAALVDLPPARGIR